MRPRAALKWVALARERIIKRPEARSAAITGADQRAELDDDRRATAEQAPLPADFARARAQAKRNKAAAWRH